jgi:hypothetical protein
MIENGFRIVVKIWYIDAQVLATRKLGMDLHAFLVILRASIKNIYKSILNFFEFEHLRINTPLLDNVSEAVFDHFWAESTKASLIFGIYDLKCKGKAKIIFELGTHFTFEAFVMEDDVLMISTFSKEIPITYCFLDGSSSTYALRSSIDDIERNNGLLDMRIFVYFRLTFRSLHWLRRLS